MQSCLYIPQRPHIATDAQRQDRRNDIARCLNRQNHPEYNLVIFIRAENRDEVDDETGTGDGSAEGHERNLNSDILQD